MKVKYFLQVMNDNQDYHTFLMNTNNLFKYLQMMMVMIMMMMMMMMIMMMIMVIMTIQIINVVLS